MFSIPEVIQLGPLLLPLHYLILAVLGLLSSYFIFIKSKTYSFPFSSWQEIILNGILTFLVIWKFSFILFHPLQVWQKPALIVLGSGGEWGIYLGLFLSGIVIYKSSLNRQFPFLLFLDLSTCWLILTATVYSVIVPSYGLPTTLVWGITLQASSTAYHPLHYYYFLLGLVILSYLYYSRVRFGRGTYTANACIWLGLGLLFISNFSYQSNRMMLLTFEQFIYIGMIVIGLILNSFLKRKSEDKGE